MFPLAQEKITGTQIGKIFCHHRETILLGVIATFIAASTMTIDLFFDCILRNLTFNIVDHVIERFALILVVTIPGSIICCSLEKSNRAQIFVCCHTIQFIGALAPILAICSNLVPSHFSRIKCLAAYILYGISGFVAFAQFGSSVMLWPISLLCVLVSVGLLLRMTFCWTQHIYARASQQERPTTFLQIINLLSADELCCMLHLICTFFALFFIPAITASYRLLDWNNFSFPDICFNMSSLSLFSVLVSCIPGRVRQYASFLQLKQQMKTNHATIRYISHEIRSPLNVVANGIELIKEQVAFEPRLRIHGYLEDVSSASSQAISIVSDLLTFEKIGAGAFQVDKKMEYVSKTLTKIAKRCATLAQQKNINFTVHDLLADGSGNVCAVNIDVLKMEQVLRNLVSNAAKFTPSGGAIDVYFRHKPSFMVGILQNHSPQLPDKSTSNCPRNIFGSKQCAVNFIKPARVKVYSSATNLEQNNRNNMVLGSINEEVDKFIWIEITDTGIGITEEQYKDVFGQFAQFNANKLQGGGGSGLGLWICKEIIKQHDGVINFYSGGAGLGTTFVIGLPICMTRKQVSFRICEKSDSNVHSDKVCLRKRECILSEGGGKDLGCSDHSRTLNVLVVDDSTTNRKMLIKMLQKIQEKHPGIFFQCTEADNGTSALECFHQFKNGFDFVFADNIMPGMNGTELAEKLRHEVHFSGWIVGVTGSVSVEEITSFKSYGADEVLEKPFTLEKLTAIILKIISKVGQRSNDV